MSHCVRCAVLKLAELREFGAVSTSLVSEAKISMRQSQMIFFSPNLGTTFWPIPVQELAGIHGHRRDDPVPRRLGVERQDGEVGKVEEVREVKHL